MRVNAIDQIIIMIGGESSGSRVSSHPVHIQFLDPALSLLHKLDFRCRGVGICD